MNRPLKCIGSDCKTETIPKSDLKDHYNWMKTNVLIEDYCTVKQVRILAETKNSDIILKGCKVENEFCETENSVIVWKKSEVLHNCPYEVVRGVFTRRFAGNIIETMLTEEAAFEVTGKITVCHPKPIDIYTTAEGLYLIREDERDKGFPLTEKNSIGSRISTGKFLLLATLDSEKIKQAQIYRELNMKNCYALVNTLQMVKQSLHDKYYKLKDISGGDLIVYIFYNQIFIPECEIINEIKIITNHEHCFEQIPVIYGKNLTGFINNQKLIQTTGTKASCSSNHIYSLIPVENNK